MNEVSWHDLNKKLGDSSPKPPGIDGAALEALAEGAEDAAEGGQMKMIQNLTGFCCRCVCFFKGAEMLVYGNIQGFCCFLVVVVVVVVVASRDFLKDVWNILRLSEKTKGHCCARRGVETFCW